MKYSQGSNFGVRVNESTAQRCPWHSGRATVKPLRTADLALECTDTQGSTGTSAWRELGAASTVILLVLMGFRKSDWVCDDERFKRTTQKVRSSTVMSIS